MGFSSFEGADFKFGTPAPGGSLEEQLAAWAREAAASRRVACIYLTAGWCPPSVLLEKSLTHPLMARALRGVNFATYDVDDSADALQAAGFPAHTIPAFFVLGADGKRVGAPITGAAWGENTPENMAPPLERFFDTPRAELGGSLPSPQVVAELMESARARASAAGRPEAPSAPVAAESPAASSKLPLLLVVVVVLVALAVAFFAK